MDELKPNGGINEALHREIDATPWLIGLSVLCLFIFPGLLVVLIPMFIIQFSNKRARETVGPGGVKVVKKKDRRRLPVAIFVALVGLVLLYLASGTPFSDNNDFVGNLMLIGICTGGFLWYPLGCYLVSCLILFVTDKMTSNASEEILGADAPAPAAHPPVHFPNLTALSPSDQSLVKYIADASSRGMTNEEMALILKGTGWIDTDIARGFELARIHYPGVVK